MVRAPEQFARGALPVPAPSSLNLQGRPRLERPLAVALGPILIVRRNDKSTHI
jgi:hypothetical protein